MTTAEVAKKLVGYCRTGDWSKAHEELYAQDAESIEPEGTHWGSVKGMDAIRKKGEEWSNMIEAFHGNEIGEPVIADNYFSMRMVSETTMKGMGRVKFEELGVYEVKNGKITKEQFFYTPMQP
jgi:hypothetical protein